jgi:hypothetical protein
MAHAMSYTLSRMSPIAGNGESFMAKMIWLRLAEDER